MTYIHLAGTNGKGSTAQYLASILSKKGKCGLYTSPHIFSPLERFRIDGVKISQQMYDKYLYLEKTDPAEHYFGPWTRVALRWFKDESVDYAVIETGLGGTKDPTNIIDSRVQLITPISLDHTDILGNDVRQIAREKCGIIKYNGNVISHPQSYEVINVIKQTCERMNCTLTVLSESAIRVKRRDCMTQMFDFNFDDLLLRDITLKTAAAVHIQNACAAAVAAWFLGADAYEIEAGLRETIIPARAEYVNGMVIDAAHNAAAMAALCENVKRLFPKKHITVLTAVMEDKDVLSIAGIIEEFADTVICTRADRKRGLGAKEFVKYFDNATPMENPVYAFDYAREINAQKNGLLVVCGSFYLVPYVIDENALNL